MLDICKCNIIQLIDRGKDLELFLAKYKEGPLKNLEMECGMTTL